MKKAAPDPTEPWPGWRLFSERNSHKCLLPHEGGVICGEILTYRNTTSNFKSHLKRAHPAVASELKAKKDRLNEFSMALSSPSPPGQSKISDFFDPGKARAAEIMHKKYVDRLEHAIVEFVAGDISPFHSVEGSCISFLSFFFTLAFYSHYFKKFRKRI